MTQHAAGGTGIPHYPLVIDGRRTESWSGRSYQTIDPFLQTAWATAADGDAGDVDLAVTAARRALSEPWGKLTGLVVGGWRRLPGGCGRGQANRRGGFQRGALSALMLGVNPRGIRLTRRGRSDSLRSEVMWAYGCAHW